MNDGINCVSIIVKGIQKDPSGEVDNIEIKTKAKYYIKKNAEYLVYDESEVTGMEGSRTRLKINSDSVIMTRVGEVETKMEFYEGKSSSMKYVCPHGVFNMDIVTKSLKVEYDEAKLSKIDINYNMDFQNDFVTEHSLSIEIM